VSTSGQAPAPIIVDTPQQTTPVDLSARQRPSDKKPRDKVKEQKHQGDNQQTPPDQSTDTPKPNKQKPEKQKKLLETLQATTDHVVHGHGRSSGHHGHD
jgi:hypothetical protein